jgi:hypothetical protein
MRENLWISVDESALSERRQTTAVEGSSRETHTPTVAARTWLAVVASRRRAVTWPAAFAAG